MWILKKIFCRKLTYEAVQELIESEGCKIKCFIKDMIMSIQDDVNALTEEATEIKTTQADIITGLAKIADMITALQQSSTVDLSGLKSAVDILRDQASSIKAQEDVITGQATS